MESKQDGDECGPKTSTRLLGSLRTAPPNQAAWAEFVARYAKVIYDWCRRWGVQDADAADITQAVLLKVSRKMRSFTYDAGGSFRGWLKTLTHHAWHDLVRRRRSCTVGRDGTEEWLQSLEAPQDSAAGTEAVRDRELLQMAMERVRRRIKPITWNAFQLTAVEGLTGSVAAARLGVPLATIYKARSNVQKLLQQEVRRLEGSGNT